jgi:nitronate monooxygenase
MGVGISGPRLAGNVAKYGAVGTIASVGLSHNSSYYVEEKMNYFDSNEIVIKETVRQARAIAGPDAILAVNCMVALTDYDRETRAAAEGGANVIISGAGLPLRLPEYTKDFPDVALVPIVSSPKAASLITRRWEKQYHRQPDGFVVETPAAAGGHLGAMTMEQVYDPALSLPVALPGVVAFVRDEMKSDIPVIAAGGIWDREDMLKAFEMGAKGVQVGTRFACTEEGDASDRFKQAYVDAKEEDVVLIQSPAGLPGRAIKNPFVAQYLEGHVTSSPCFANCLTHCRYRRENETFCIAKALVDAFNGDWEKGLFFCGSNVTKVDKVSTVKEVLSDFFPELA